MSRWIRKKFGSRVERLRRQQKITQEELGLRAGFDRSYVGGLERGERNPSLKNIYKISKALKVSLSKLFDF